MANWKKLAQGAAGAAGGAGLDVSEVFSTYLYEGTGAAQTITNNIDLSTEGGMIWMKQRNGTANFPIVNTENGRTLYHFTNRTFAQQTTSSTTTDVTSFNTNGYSIGLNYQANLNSNGGDYVSWTFRKAPKFFDVQTFSTTSSSSVPITVNHNLGSVPGFYLIKRTDSGSDWFCFHRSQGATKYGALQNTDQFQNGGTSKWYQAPDSSSIYLGNDFVQNASYVAYFFAHNDGDGDFGPTGDQDIIKCGGFNSGSTDIVDVDLGFEPQWIMIKKSSTTGDWQIFDVMRGAPHGSDDQILAANSSASEVNSNRIKINPNGFTASGFGTNTDYIYIAIRRGPMAVPTSATDVFDANAITGNGAETVHTTGFTVDAHLSMRRSANYPNLVDRMRGFYSGTINNTKRLATHVTNAETSLTGNFYLGLDQNDGYKLGPSYENSSSTNYIQYSFRRAPNFFDIVAYTGNGTAGNTISHNLGVAPEMMWVKGRSNTNLWGVYHSALGATKYLRLDTTAAEGTATSVWNDTEPTATQFTLGTSGALNTSGVSHIAYLFASLDGVSKIGTYSGSSSDVNVDCGFSSGARFVLIKRINASGGWYVYDSARGIVSGNDPRLLLDETSSENTGVDEIDPYSSGFTVVGGSGNSEVNFAGSTYIFYAIA